MKVSVLGAGLAGSEAAYQLAHRGVLVDLYEMRPIKLTPAHTSGNFAELVCSNSLRSDRIENAAGLLKEELRAFDSVIMACADAHSVPAGDALAVDREGYSAAVTERVLAEKNINFIQGEVTEIPEGVVIIAAGPLCEGALAEKISELTGKRELFFFDAAAPIVTKDSLDFNKIFAAGRYGRSGDYLNCPMTRVQYDEFVNALVSAETAPVHGFEGNEVFEGCMPVEVMAKRGHMTLAFGSCTPKGITDPLTGKMPYAVVQLRRDNAADTLYNIVGFQTHLKFGEQKRVFSMIPGLENAEFVRYGVMHRNTYICSPVLLNQNFQMKNNPDIFFAGQITGVEGYLESTASGMCAALSAFDYINGKPLINFTDKTAIGALGYYVSSGSGRNFQPININFGILAPLEQKIKDKQERGKHYAQRSNEIISQLKGEM